MNWLGEEIIDSELSCDSWEILALQLNLIQEDESTWQGIVRAYFLEIKGIFNQFYNKHNSLTFEFRITAKSTLQCKIVHERKNFPIFVSHSENRVFIVNIED